MTIKMAFRLFLGIYCGLCCLISFVYAECLLCNFKATSKATGSGASHECNDLFKAACLRKNGKPKYRGYDKEFKSSIQKIIDEARNKTFQDMGFKNLEEAVHFKLKEAGMELSKNPSQEEWEEIKKHASLRGSLDFKHIKSCENEMNNIKDQLYESNTEEDLKNAPEKIEHFKRKYTGLLKEYYVKDIPSFFDQLRKVCSRLEEAKTKGSTNLLPENRKLFELCRTFSAIKLQAVDVYRQEGSPSYSQKAKQFIESYFFIPQNKYKPSRNRDKTAPQNKFKEQRQFLQDSVGNFNICRPLNRAMGVYADLLLNEVMEVSAKSKKTIDHLIDAFYTEDNKETLNEMFHSANADVQDLLSVLVKNPKEMDNIKSGFKSFRFEWLEKPKPENYEKKKGILSLKESLFPSDVSMIFEDFSLSHFTAYNAMYMPSFSANFQEERESIMIYPVKLHLLRRNPFSFFAVVAHEVGHKVSIGGASSIKDSQLLSEYTDLLTCYKDKKSINIQTYQYPEVLADYISSEVLARQVSKLPLEKRKQAILAAMEGSCVFNEIEGFHLDCKGFHPHPSLRASGIYGANPSIRRMLGCQGDSPFFKTCGLRKSILDIKEGSYKKSKGDQTPQEGAR